MSTPHSRFPLLIAASVLVSMLAAVMMWWLNAPSVEFKPLPAISHKAPVPVIPASSPPAHLPTPSTPDPRAIDPDIQRLADDLASKEQTPMRDLEIVNEFITLYSKAFQGNPIGLNEDITSVLTGNNYTKGILFPPNSPMIVRGQLVDRWGTPYWFHPSSASQMEIRSAGPDKDLFSGDDIVINPGPDRTGAVTQASPSGQP